MNYRTYIHKDCDKEVFGLLFESNPHHRKVGTNKHAFITGTLRELLGDAEADYPHIHLALYDWTGQELYEFISTKIGDEDYRGAIETSEDQTNLMLEYVFSITPVDVSQV